MSQSWRPHYNVQKDSNHYIPLKACQYWGGGFPKTKKSVLVYRGHVRRYPVELYDTNKMGGQFVDWIAVVNGLALFIEVKTPRVLTGKRRPKLSDREYYAKQLKPGELAFFYYSKALKIIAASEEACWIAITSMLEVRPGQVYKSSPDYEGLFPPDFDYRTLIDSMELEVNDE
jgi:hypothetical protein